MVKTVIIAIIILIILFIGIIIYAALTLAKHWKEED
jgi:nitric oxide reductase large subunit